MGAIGATGVGPPGATGPIGPTGITGATGATGLHGGARAPFSITTIDTVGPASTTAITIGADGLALITYNDASSGDLMVTHCNDAACITSTTTSIDATVAIGEQSITVGPDGFGLISYYDQTNADLKAAHCTNTACSTSTRATLFPADDFVGRFSSIAITPTGLAQVSHYDSTNGNLKVLNCSNPACTSGKAPSISIGADTGPYTSIATGTDGLALISFHDDGVLKVAHCTNAPCTTHTVTAVDGSDGRGPGTSLVIGADGMGLIAYPGEFGLSVAHCTNLECSTFTVTSTATPTPHNVAVTIGTDHDRRGRLWIDQL